MILVFLTSSIIGVWKTLSSALIAGYQISIGTEIAYIFLVDCSFQFCSSTFYILFQGFSRGAYQVRALAGMIEKVLVIPSMIVLFRALIDSRQVGLIHKGNEEQISL